ncbi:MAG: dihydrolipoyl dehydrogenase [Deltaproteobacteria bacterium]|nr:dihydrolipoyl dehydrogenase [Deltaproteobacteria bacterium]
MEQSMENKERITCDLTIIGGGPGGYAAALEAVSRGFTVTLVERERIGGTCLVRGCVPTQCLLHDLNQYRLLGDCEYIEKDGTPVRLSFEKVMDRKNRVVDLLVSGTEKTLEARGVTIARGGAAFLDPRTVSVNPSGQVIHSRYVVIATGSRCKSTPPLVFDHEYIWDTTDALNMESVPGSIAIVGGGVRAMTFAEIFHYLGSKVHLVVHDARILPDMDRGITSRYRKVLREKKIDLLTGTRVARVETGTKGGPVELTLEGRKGTRSLKVDRVLVPGDREAEVEGLNLGRIGLSLREGLVPVDGDLMTRVPGVYAIGDAVGGRYTAHKAVTEGRVLARRLGGENPRIEYELVPICLYTSPELASIGLTQEEAEKREEEIGIGYFPFAAGSRPAIFGESEGIVKIVFEKRYGEVLGVHIIGYRATELIALASMAMKNELSLNEIREVIYPHPSFAEALAEAVNDGLDTMDQKASP